MKETKKAYYLAASSAILFCSAANSAINFNQGDIDVRLNGRASTDVAWFSHDENTIIRDGTGVRSFRLGAKGSLCDICHFSVSVDFRRSNAAIQDMWLYFEPTDNLRVNVGNYKPPMSLEFIDSNLDMTFMERALPNVFVTGRRVGLGIDYYQQLNNGYHLIYSLGGFTESADNVSSSDLNQEYNVSSRINLMNIASSRCYWLSGFGFSYTRTDTTNTLRYAPRPESSVNNVRLVDTATIVDAQSASLINYEFAWQLNRFSLQGEYFYNRVSRNQNESLSFDGYYIYASYFLTDDFRPIKKKFSKHGRVKPTCRWGALELATRLSQVDLNSRNIQGGKEQNWTLGLNWYLNQYIRFMANYINVDAKKDALTSKVHIYTLRAQFDFK